MTIQSSPKKPRVIENSTINIDVFSNPSLEVKSANDFIRRIEDKGKSQLISLEDLSLDHQSRNRPSRWTRALAPAAFALTAISATTSSAAWASQFSKSDGIIFRTQIIPVRTQDSKIGDQLRGSAILPTENVYTQVPMADTDTTQTLIVPTVKGRKVTTVLEQRLSEMRAAGLVTRFDNLKLEEDAVNVRVFLTPPAWTDKGREALINMSFELEEALDVTVIMKLERDRGNA